MEILDESERAASAARSRQGREVSSKVNRKDSSVICLSAAKAEIASSTDPDNSAARAGSALRSCV
jgi:hypothetical protein